ncbi:hypothetical protein Tco_1443179 [Tanacetum coccineum]
MLRLCHRLIAYGIDGRSQTPEKVTVTDLFYLRGMDVGSVNIPYLLARYLRLFTSGKKQGAMISEGQLVTLLAEHFGLLTEERLHGLTVIVRDLPVIDMVELVVVAGVPDATEDDPVADEGAPAVPTPMYEIQRALGEQREILDSMARDFSRFSTWTVVGLSQMMNQTGVRTCLAVSSAQ